MRTRAALLWLFFAALVAYLSFVPFRFQPLEFEQALARFWQIRYLDLGAGNRADWVANILMYLPLGAAAAAFFVPHPRRRFDPLAVIPSLILGAGWAVAVEFGQLYFAGRTVSLNDILAEVIGTFAGACLWSAFGARGRDWWRTLLLGGRATANAALGGYLLAYLVLSFSPFDFVISADELAHKAASNLNGWWLAPVSCGPTPCSVKLLVEVLAVLPFGWWLATRRHGGGLFAAALVGAVLGLLIEAAQFLLVSGTSQGASVVSRAAGVALGAWLHSARHRILAIDWARWGRPLVLVALLPYLAAVAYVAGWFGNRWLGLEAGLARAGQIQWMPFFFQYFSTEQALIRSTLVHLFLYAPLGVGVWLWGRRTGSSSGWVAALLAAAVAIVAETGKLFVRGKHPDYTDVLLAVVAAWTAATLLRWASSKKVVDVPAPAARPPRAASRARLPQSDVVAGGVTLPGSAGATQGVVEPARTEAATWPARVTGAMAMLVVAVSLLRFPVWPLPLAVGLAAYAALLARRPLAYLLVVPMALPVLDLAPWSGRFFWDEFDLLLATTIGVKLLLATSSPRDHSRLPTTALLLLALSLLASTAIALWPPAPLDANAFTNYLSPYNALRVAKGYVWGAALLWLIWRDAATQRRTVSLLTLGLGLGLLSASLGAFWERLLFVAPADIGAWFRAAGFVSATHVGGAYLEAMLVVLTPFALALAAMSSRARTAAFWYAVALLGGMAVLATLSRAAAASWLVVVATFALLWWMGSRRVTTGRVAIRWRWTVAAAALALMASTAWVAQSTYLRDRLALTDSDLAVRLAHWREAFSLIRGDPLHVAFGMGLGSFPREFYVVHAGPQQLAAYRLEREPAGGRTYLALSGGRGMYVDQRVGAKAGRELLLSGEVRSSREDATLAIALCEKSFLSSARCESSSVKTTTDWQPFEVRLRLPAPSGNRFGPQAPLALSLYNSAFGTRVEVTRLSLRDGAVELLANGSFDRGLDRWLVHSDVHSAWRALSTPVQLIFEQGLLGALAWLALGLSFVAVAVRRAGELPVAAATAAAIGFIAVGSFDTLLDAPRVVLLASLVLAAAILAGEGRRLGPVRPGESRRDSRTRRSPDPQSV